MRSCIYRKNEFVIYKKSKGYIVVNTKGAYENHSHFDYSLEAAISCINFVIKKVIPNKSRYMAIACKRLSINPEYIERIEQSLKNSKDKYINYRNLMRCDSYRRSKGGAIRQVRHG